MLGGFDFTAFYLGDYREPERFSLKDSKDFESDIGISNPSEPYKFTYINLNTGEKEERIDYATDSTNN